MPLDWKSDINELFYFDTRVRNILLAAGIATADQLMEMSRRDLLSLGNVGPRTLETICWVLEKVAGRDPRKLLD
jgi:DNA-directed RNA polymerase alpha subunit